MEYCIISVPREKENDIFEKVYKYLSVKHQLGNVLRFNIPELKVGTFDKLMELSEKINKLDNLTDTLIYKFVHYMTEILEEEKSKLSTYLNINQESYDKCALKFCWDDTEFSTKEPLEKTYSSINDKVTDIEIELKNRSKSYNKIKLELENDERKNSGSLLTRDLTDLVKQEHFIKDSEYLVTLLVVVSKSHFQLWLSSYGRMTEFVVPYSSELIYQDNEYGLFNVTLFRKSVNNFTSLSKEKKFYVREFVYDETKIKTNQLEKIKLSLEKKKEFVNTFRWLTNKFKILVGYLLHIKSMKIFVESVLRYGLPVNFQSILIVSSKNQQKKIHYRLGKMFHHLDSELMRKTDHKINGAEDEEEFVACLLGESDYFPYVCTKLDMNFLK